MKYYAIIKDNIITDVKVILNDNIIEKLKKEPTIDKIIEVEDDGYKNGMYINKPYRNINELKEDMFEQVDTMRDNIIKNGVQYTFPDGQIGTIQTRNQIDERNIQANTSAAHSYILSGKNTENMIFRDAENKNHIITAQQMIEMTMYVKSKGQEIYTKSWTIKDEIQTLIEQYNIEELKNYTISFD